MLLQARDVWNQRSCEVQNISKSIFYRIINYDRQVNLAMNDDETQASYSASILRNSAIRDGRLLYSILKY